MNSYEIMMVVIPNASKENIDRIVKKMERIITDNGGKIKEIQEIGMKKLAYPIKGAIEGLYLLFQFNTLPKTIKELEQMLKLEEMVLRYLIVKQRVIVKPKEKKLPIKSKAEEKEEEEIKGEDLSGEL